MEAFFDSLYDSLINSSASMENNKMSYSQTTKNIMQAKKWWIYLVHDIRISYRHKGSRLLPFLRQRIIFRFQSFIACVCQRNTFPVQIIMFMLLIFRSCSSNNARLMVIFPCCPAKTKTKVFFQCLWPQLGSCTEKKAFTHGKFCVGKVFTEASQYQSQYAE